ncbi:MAG: hypothetical protein K8R85_02425 [Bacteroidetes bacterium]|nr:hypothetical protein [Bacteroidota bacterium]
MKFFLNLFVLVLFISNAHNFVEKKRIYSEKVSSIENIIEIPLDALSEGNLQTVNQDSSDGIPHKQKKRNRKGVNSTLFCIVNESDCRINKLDNKFIFLTQVSYWFQPFSSNGKRGPPFGCFVS